MIKKLFAAIALTAILGLGAFLFIPSLRARVEYVPLRLQTWWEEQQPHDMFVPTPAAAEEVVTRPAPTTAGEALIVPTPAPLATPVAEPPQPTQPPAARPTTLPTANPTAAPRATAVPLPGEIKLVNFRHEYQGWNNCGPTTVSMLLSHYGYTGTQYEIAPVMKPNPNDKNVGPDELAGYIQGKYGLQSVYRINGDLNLLKGLIANGLPVIVETWFTPKPNDGMGHYRLLIGYSDSKREFLALDAYNGPNVTLPYDDFDANWKVFDRTYVVSFLHSQADTVASIIGYAMADRPMWEQAQVRAQAEIQAKGDDAFAWFNLGDALNALGQTSQAAQAFDRARQIGLPWRMLWYQFEPFEAYLAVNRYQDVLDLAAANLKQANDLEESYYYRGRALQALGKTDEAAAAYREALRLRGSYAEAAKALQALVPPH